MSEGPFRMSRESTDRSAASRQEPPQKQPEEPPRLVVKEEPKPVHRTASSHRLGHDDEKSFKRFLLPIGIALAVIVTVVLGWLFWSNTKSGDTGIDSSKYQAVFFTNGQVYFGKLHTFNDGYMKLTDIYYLQTQSSSTSATDSKNPQQTTTDQNNPTLIKLGDEIHGPEDEMIIAKDQVLFYENLKSDGKVAQSIDKYKNPNK